MKIHAACFVIFSIDILPPPPPPPPLLYGVYIFAVACWILDFPFLCSDKQYVILGLSLSDLILPFNGKMNYDRASLTWTHKTKCTNPHDYIISMNGMCRGNALSFIINTYNNLSTQSKKKRKCAHTHSHWHQNCGWSKWIQLLIEWFVVYISIKMPKWIMNWLDHKLGYCFFFLCLLTDTFHSFISSFNHYRFIIMKWSYTIKFVCVCVSN